MYGTWKTAYNFSKYEYFSPKFIRRWVYGPVAGATITRDEDGSPIVSE